MENLSKIELIKKKVEFFSNWIEDPIIKKYKEAIVLFFFL